MRFVAGELIKAMKAVEPARSKDDDPICLTGIRFKFKNGKCNICASDEFSIYSETVDYIGSEPGEFIIPYTELPKDADEIEVIYDNSSVTFNCLNGYKYSVPVIQEKYINIEGAVPEGEAEYEIVFNPNRLQQALATMGNENIRSAVWYEPYGCYVAVRKLTSRECFRLQGWNDDYYKKAAFVNSESQLYKQAGNGVTVNVIRGKAKELE
jgi:hypothetical protein